MSLSAPRNRARYVANSGGKYHTGQLQACKRSGSCNACGKTVGYKEQVLYYDEYRFVCADCAGGEVTIRRIENTGL